MLPLNVMVLARFAGVLAVLGGLWWLVDEIGDRREVKVHARYAVAAKLTNDDIAKFNDDDARIAAVRQALVAKALADAGRVEGTHPATAAQAKAINDIRKAGR